MTHTEIGKVHYGINKQVAGSFMPAVAAELSFQRQRPGRIDFGGS